MTRLKNGYGRHKKNIQITTVDQQEVAFVGLGHRKQTMISLSDIEILKEHSFYAKQRKDGKWVARSSQTGAYLHRLLIKPDDEQEVDHVDADPLNNTRGNLRPCTKRQNSLAKQSTLFKGFCGIHQTKWGWYKALNGEGRKVGRYDTALEAAKARDELMMDDYFHSESGEELHTYGFINWNFPEEVPHLKKLIESDDFLFDEIQEAQMQAYDLLLEKGWN